MKTSFVRGVIASRMASRSNRSSAQWTPNGDPAELEGVEHVARKRRPAGDGLVPLVERDHREVADDGVGSGAHRHVLEVHTVPLGERVAEPPGTSVRIPVELERGARNRLLGSRKRPEGPRSDASLTTRSSPCSRCDLLDGLSGLDGTSSATARRITDGSMSPGRRLTLPAEAPRPWRTVRWRRGRPRPPCPRALPRRHGDGARAPPAALPGCLPTGLPRPTYSAIFAVFRRRCFRRRSSTLSTVYPNTAFLLLMTLMETG